MRALHDELRSDPRQPLQLKQFFGSVTTLRAEAMGPRQMQRILDAIGLDAIGLDAAGLPSATAGADGDADRLVILRHTLMNPYLIDRENGISYIDLYFEHLARRVRALLSGGWR